MDSERLFEQLLPQGTQLEVEDVAFGSDVVVQLQSLAGARTCPSCTVASNHIHSRYSRSVQDVPCFKQAVRLKLQVRRFRCLNQSCSRQTFAERFDALAKPYARHTRRLEEVLERIGLMVGGEPGARLLKAFALTVSPDKLLTCVHRLDVEALRCPSVIGIDDFAFRRGVDYGTLVVDIERGKPVELLCSREVPEVSRWLEQQPQLETVTRDRAKEYALAIRQGAPQARQVMDRWHVLKNLREALERDLTGQGSNVQEIFQTAGLLGRGAPRSRQERVAQSAALEKRQERFGQVHALHQQKMSITQIAKKLGVSKNTVRDDLRADTPPQVRRNAQRQGPLDTFRKQLEQHFSEGCRNAKALWRDLKTQGYNGSYQPVRRWLHERRQLPSDATVKLRVTPRFLSSLLIKDQAQLGVHEKMAVELMAKQPRLGQLVAFAAHFRIALLQRQPAKMATWSTDVEASDFTALRNFAAGLRKEWDALIAACSSAYSNGPTEGAVNRLKLIKRQMYGRGSFSLLRKRVLLSS